ncbi:MAG: putative nucleic acid-binding protein [Akkermansiaceae bacterium]|jgi:predicted nucleic acid-binding protein
MRIAVKDANILIDLELMGLLDLWFQLEIETLTTSLVVNELIRGNHHLTLAHIDSGTIESVALDPYELALKIEGFEGTGLSEGDVSVFLLAEQRDAFLLSGDSALRVAAEVQQIEVHGTIWILDQLIEKG